MGININWQSMPVKQRGEAEDIGGVMVEPVYTGFEWFNIPMLKNISVLQNNDGKLYKGTTVGSGSDTTIYKQLFAQSLQEGIDRWKTNPNQQYIMLLDNYRPSFYRIVSKPTPKPAPEPIVTKEKQDAQPEPKPKPIPEWVIKNIPPNVKIEEVKDNIVKLAVEDEGEVNSKLIDMMLNELPLDDVVYEDWSPEQAETAVLEEKLEQGNSTQPLVYQSLPSDNSDKAAVLYSYPNKNLHIYKIPANIAFELLNNLKNQNSDATQQPVVEQIYTNVPLTNLPQGQLNDTTWHNIVIPENKKDFWKDSTVYQPFFNSLAYGYHTGPNVGKAAWVRQSDLDHREEPIKLEDNVFYKLHPAKDYVNYVNIFAKPPQRGVQTTVPVESGDILDTYSWEDIKRQSNPNLWSRFKNLILKQSY